MSIPGQQSLLSSGGNNNGSLVTYLQPLGNLGVPVSNMDQNQVIITSSDLQGNLTLHNVPGLSTKRNGMLILFTFFFSEFRSRHGTRRNEIKPQF